MKIFIFLGTTAELIKLAPIIREFNKKKVSFSIIASGQNDIHFEEFPWIGKVKVIRAVTPKGKKNSIFAFLIWSARTFFSLLVGMRSNFRGLNKTNSLFIVHGDTVSSLMGSFVASIYGLKLVHIESGLRSFHFFEPFPEEACRYIISRLASVHFCPNEWAVKNLQGIGGVKVNTRQNTLIETLWMVMKNKSRHPLVRKMSNDGKYFVLVIHRQEHVLFHTKYTQDIVRFILHNIPPNMRCLFLVHDISTNLVESVEYLIPKEISRKIVKVNRLPYKDFMHLLHHAEYMVTDGGSNQEEMYYMGKPCLLLRNSTERREGLGGNVVLSRNDKRTIANFLINYKQYVRRPIHTQTPPSKIISQFLFGSLR